MGNAQGGTASTVSSGLADFKNKSIPSNVRDSQDDFGEKNDGSTSSDVADISLGRLRSADYRIGKILYESKAFQGSVEGLDDLWPVSTFLFLRLSEKKPEVNFHCSVRYTTNNVETSLLVIQKRKFASPEKFSNEDNPLDIFETKDDPSKQILGIMFRPRAITPNENSDLSFGFNLQQDSLKEIEVYSILGAIGAVNVRRDWKSSYEIRNYVDSSTLIVERFNRIAGGWEFQIYAMSQVDLAVCVATVVRLEESKFILKIYAPYPPISKALMLNKPSLIESKMQLSGCLNA